MATRRKHPTPESVLAESCLYALHRNLIRGTAGNEDVIYARGCIARFQPLLAAVEALRGSPSWAPVLRLRDNPNHTFTTREWSSLQFPEFQY